MALKCSMAAALSVTQVTKNKGPTSPESRAFFQQVELVHFRASRT